MARPCDPVQTGRLPSLRHAHRAHGGSRMLSSHVACRASQDSEEQQVASVGDSQDNRSISSSRQRSHEAGHSAAGDSDGSTQDASSEQQAADEQRQPSAAEAQHDQLSSQHASHGDARHAEQNASQDAQQEGTKEARAEIRKLIASTQKQVGVWLVVLMCTAEPLQQDNAWLQYLAEADHWQHPDLCRLGVFYQLHSSSKGLSELEAQLRPLQRDLIVSAFIRCVC